MRPSANGRIWTVLGLASLAGLYGLPVRAEGPLMIVGCAEQRGFSFYDEPGHQSDRPYILLRNKEDSKEFFRIYADAAATKTQPWPSAGPVTAAIVPQRTFDWIAGLARPIVVEARRSSFTTIIIRTAAAAEKCP
jgi:hypothetical protein